MIANVSKPEVARPGAEGAMDFEDLIARCQTGCINSRNRTATMVQPEIYELASRMSSQQSFARSLHATMIVNETFIRLAKSGLFRNPKSRAYFFAAVSQAVRNVIADYLRHKMAAKRSPVGKHVYLDDVLDSLASCDIDFRELDQALEMLESKAPRQTQIVQMRLFLGMSVPEISRQLAISVSTVEADWRKARAWRYRELN